MLSISLSELKSENLVFFIKFLKLLELVVLLFIFTNLHLHLAFQHLVVVVKIIKFVLTNYQKFALELNKMRDAACTKLLDFFLLLLI